MDCPTCYGDTRVINSREGKDLIRRRRECAECKVRFTTVEVVVDSANGRQVQVPGEYWRQKYEELVKVLQEHLPQHLPQRVQES